MKNSTIIVPVAVSAILGIGYTVGRAQNNNTDSSSITESSHVVGTYSGQSTDFIYAAENTVNCVVHIMTKYTPKTSSSSGQPNFGGNDIFEYFFGDRGGFQQLQPQPRSASGSGVILEKEGYIVTNNHVVEGADSITVVLNDKRSYVAKIVGTDPSTDLALIKVEADNLPAIKIGDSENLRVGEWVLAVGNPFNLTSTVTAGIVSAKARNINILSGDMKIESFIQTDAAVNPGNSGGALVNTKGELVGINAAIASQTGSYTGYSFAIPVTIMSKVVNDLKKYGVVQRALLGVMVQDITSELAKEKNLSVLDGAYVANVNDNSAAKEAGIEVGDVIIKVNGKAVKSVPEVQEQVSKFSPGNTINVTVLRKKKELTIPVVLKNQMGDTKIVKQASVTDLGATFEVTSDADKQKFGISSGITVKSVTKDGKFAVNGIQPGLIILKANNQTVNSVEDLQQIVAACKKNNGQKYNEQALFISGLYKGKLTYYAVDLN
ncbi:MAG: Do family serine endopeptidase [Paludibacteraceae bacterium]|nr:Do family serine endopeptidase [Paludibacteraceae bacterium]